MPIKHLQGGHSLPVIGKIKKGEMQGKRPVDLPYFKFICPDKNVQDKVSEYFGEKPAEFTGFFVSENAFTAWMQEWTTASLLRRCDGDQVQLELVGDKLVSPENKQCLYPNCKCKPNSILRIIIRRINPAACFELTTNSSNDIRHIDECINGFVGLANQMGIDISQIPILFRKEKVSVSVPFQGKRIRVDKYLIKIQIHPMWIEKLGNSKFLLKGGQE